MSANANSFPQLSQTPDVLGELLHSLSQPLTTLRCSLELSLLTDRKAGENTDEKAHPQQETVSAALQQTDRVIGLIQLMREYVEAEQPTRKTESDSASTVVALAVRSVIEDLRSIAAIRCIRLRLAGTCTVSLPLPESRLRLALQYLITAMLEARADGGNLTLLLGEGPAGAVLRVEDDRGVRLPESRDYKASTVKSPRRNRAYAHSTLRTARLAIARRLLETAGASLIFANSPADQFVLRIPRQKL